MNWRVNGCCCFSLRTGSLIIGYLGLIGNALMLIGCIVGLASTREWVEEYVKDGASKPPSQSELDAIVTVVQVILAVALCVILVNGIISLLLLLGVYKEKPQFLYICVIAGIVYCVLGALGTVGYLIMSFSNAKFFGNVISSLISLAFQIYYTMVVHSYRLELLESSVRAGTNMPKHF